MNNYILFLFSFSLVSFVVGCSTRGNGVYKPATPTTYYKTTTPPPKTYTHPTMRPYVINGVKYYPQNVKVGEKFEGIASWYGPNFHGKWTSNGEHFNMYDLTAAHKTFPMNTLVKVTNKNNNKSVIVRINDRGPFVGNRIIDLSKAAAKKIDMIGTGTAPVTLEIIGFATKNPPKKQQIQKQQLSSHQNQLNSTKKYALQIGSFSNIKGAIKLQEKYDGFDGYSTIIKDIQNKNGRIYKVWLEGFQNEEEVRKYKALGKFQNAFIVIED